MSALKVTLAADDLTVRFGESPGLRHITFTVRAGERLAIVGPSGVGKSSLLRAMAGLSPLHAGRVLVDGVDVTLAPPERRNMVFLHQTPTLFPHLPVLENVSFPQRVRGVRATEADADARRLLVTLGLEGLERRRPEALSGGQRHRVALARALMARPAVLLLDEPLGALDPSLRTEVRAAIQLAQERMGGALVIVTHDLDEALLMGDEVAVLLDGEIVQRSSPRELCEVPASLRIARFLEMPNIIATTRLADGQLSSVLGIVPRSSTIREPVLVARADALRVVRPDSAAVHGVVVAVHHRTQRVTTSIDVQGVRCDAIDDERAAEPGSTVGILVDWSRIALVSSG